MNTLLFSSTSLNWFLFFANQKHNTILCPQTGRGVWNAALLGGPSLRLRSPQQGRPTPSLPVCLPRLLPPWRGLKHRCQQLCGGDIFFFRLNRVFRPHETEMQTPPQRGLAASTGHGFGKGWKPDRIHPRKLTEQAQAPRTLLGGGGVPSPLCVLLV